MACLQLNRGEPFRALSRSPDETRAIGRAFGKLLRQGDIIYIYGEIGAGKTVFVSGIAASMDIADYITSPTFTIVNIYEGSLFLCHFDAYRIESRAELLETGFYEYAGGNCAVVVEWAEKIHGFCPAAGAEVRIEAAAGNENDTDRIINITFNA